MWGIYLDEGSSDMIISNNVVYNSGWGALFQHYGANNTIINNVFARASLIVSRQAGDPAPDADVHVQRAEDHISWTYTRNIVYDTFQGANHSAFTCDPNVIAPFSNNSVITDPLFAGDVTQCDFFTVQANSPAAKLGFVNLTKPSKWTPGCDTGTISTQFYHW